MRVVTHSIIVFLCLNKRGSMTLGWLGCVGGAGDADVGVQQGGQRWVSETMYNLDS